VLVSTLPSVTRWPVWERAPGSVAGLDGPWRPMGGPNGVGDGATIIDGLQLLSVVTGGSRSQSRKCRYHRCRDLVPISWVGCNGAVPPRCTPKNAPSDRDSGALPGWWRQRGNRTERSLGRVRM